MLIKTIYSMIRITYFAVNLSTKDEAVLYAFEALVGCSKKVTRKNTFPGRLSVKVRQLYNLEQEKTGERRNQ